MEFVKALLTLRYRPLSDTVIASVDALEAENSETSSVPDINAGVVRERLDADTTAEWIPFRDSQVLVGLEQMHASVRSYVDGMPPVVAQFVTDLIELTRDSQDVSDSTSSLLKTHELKRRVDVSMLLRPVQLQPKRRASRATSKGVEAALHQVIENYENLPRPSIDEKSVASALRDLAMSISDGEGLTSERTVDATFNTISKSGMRSQRKKTELLALVNDLRDQRTWQSAIDKALTTPELVSNAESDAELNGAD
jgi:hypothetical protein